MKIYQCSICEWYFDSCFENCPHCGFEIEYSCVIADTSDRQRITELEQQLAAMTAERDAAVGRCGVLEFSTQSACNHIVELCGVCPHDVRGWLRVTKDGDCAEICQTDCENDCWYHYYVEQARKELND